MKRRSCPRVPLLQSAFAFRLLMLVVIALSILGCVHFTRIVLEIQAHYAAGAEHPWDYWAECCFTAALLGLAMFFLTRTERTAGTILHTRVKSTQVWHRTRRLVLQTYVSPKKAKRSRRSSGYNNGNDT